MTTTTPTRPTNEELQQALEAYRNGDSTLWEAYEAKYDAYFEATREEREREHNSAENRAARVRNAQEGAARRWEAQQHDRDVEARWQESVQE